MVLEVESIRVESRFVWLPEVNTTVRKGRRAVVLTKVPDHGDHWMDVEENIKRIHYSLDLLFYMLL